MQLTNLDDEFRTHTILCVTLSDKCHIIGLGWSSLCEIKVQSKVTTESCAVILLIASVCVCVWVCARGHVFRLGASLPEVLSHKHSYQSNSNPNL